MPVDGFVRFETETPMREQEIWIDNFALVFEGQVAPFEFELNQDYILSWYLKGNREQEYVITVELPPGYEARFFGSHPIEGSIPKRHNNSGDTRRFYVRRR